MGKRIFLFGFLAGCALLIQGCGFHLRGDVTLPSSISPVHIQGLGAYDNLRTELTSLLSSNNISVADQKGGASTRLRISNRSSDRRTLSVDANGKVAEYELQEGASFELIDNTGGERVKKQHISVVRAYLNSEELVLGKQEEEDMLRKEMERDLANRILNRLRAQL